MDLGMPVDPRDLPASLEWEQPVWDWYRTLSRQWRLGPAGPFGVDMSVWLPVIDRQGWDMNVALELLSALEQGLLTDPDSTEAAGNGRQQ